MTNVAFLAIVAVAAISPLFCAANRYKKQKVVKLIVPHKIKYVHHTHVLLIKPKKKEKGLEEGGYSNRKPHHHLHYHHGPKENKHEEKQQYHYILPVITKDINLEGHTGFNNAKRTGYMHGGSRPTKLEMDDPVADPYYSTLQTENDEEDSYRVASGDSSFWTEASPPSVYAEEPVEYMEPPNSEISYVQPQQYRIMRPLVNNEDDYDQYNVKVQPDNNFVRNIRHFYNKA